MSLIPQVQADAVQFDPIQSTHEITGAQNPSSLTTFRNTGELGPLVMTVLSVIIAVAMIIMLGRIVLGAYKMITQSDNTKSVSEGRSMIMWAVIGVLVLAGALVVVQIVQGILGAQIIDFGNPTPVLPTSAAMPVSL